MVTHEVGVLSASHTALGRRRCGHLGRLPTRLVRWPGIADGRQFRRHPPELLQLQRGLRRFWAVQMDPSGIQPSVFSGVCGSQLWRLHLQSEAAQVAEHHRKRFWDVDLRGGDVHGRPSPREVRPGS